MVENAPAPDFALTDDVRIPLHSLQADIGWHVRMRFTMKLADGVEAGDAGTARSTAVKDGGE
ncbi:hypothetical protein DLM45_10760 [Hyphomicrobium methylovorum]|uniref:hypothetical protein n=1 Tax=Hyphomicrobium methylovorum TaxID=84 RepID=UPI0015E682E0|nr:hypothetical protein [Hyphomicrobium methylovorum]MBA2126692.1 hypothetical protein [Hyphomicrobium methylovorum]